MSKMKVLIAVPGPSVMGAVCQALLRTCVEMADVAEIDLVNYISANGWQNHNQAWCDALRRRDEEGFTHFAMLHADVDPSPGWLVGLLNILQNRPELSLVSAPVSIKDEKGLVSCGIGDTTDPWWPYRRLTNFENLRLPKVATEDDLFSMWKLPLSKADRCGKFLIHNNGCWAANLQNDAWDTEVDLGDGQGKGIPCFLFPMKIKKEVDEKTGKVTRKVICNPEDFNFSRMAYLTGVKTAIASQISTMHWQGHVYFRSHHVVRAGQPMGMWKFDHQVGSLSAHTDEERKVLKMEEGWYREVA